MNTELGSEAEKNFREIIYENLTCFFSENSVEDVRKLKKGHRQELPKNVYEYDLK